MRGTIVVIEDDEAIAEAIRARLEAAGFTVVVAGDGPGGVAAVERHLPDLVVLDLMLPGFDGMEVCRRIQAERRVPIVMVTARDDEADVLVGLGLGADDYVTKPFSPRELLARVEAVLRRSTGDAATSPRSFVIGDVVVDVDRRTVARAGAPTHLTQTEFDLLVCLASRTGAVLTRERLLYDVWGYREAAGGRTVDSHVRALRRKLGAGIVRTVHAVGYAIGDGDGARTGEGDVGEVAPESDRVHEGGSRAERAPS